MAKARALDAARTAPSNIIDIAGRLAARSEAAERAEYINDLDRVALCAVADIEKGLRDSKVAPLDCAAFVLAMFVKQRAYRDEMPIRAVLDGVTPVLEHYAIMPIEVT
jgi:hypothetical protein